MTAPTAVEILWPHSVRKRAVCTHSDARASSIRCKFDFIEGTNSYNGDKTIADVAVPFSKTIEPLFIKSAG